jgi:hypothetical protein
MRKMIAVALSVGPTLFGKLIVNLVASLIVERGLSVPAAFPRIVKS